MPDSEIVFATFFGFQNRPRGAFAVYILNGKKVLLPRDFELHGPLLQIGFIGDKPTSFSPCTAPWRAVIKAALFDRVTGLKEKGDFVFANAPERVKNLPWVANARRGPSFFKLLQRGWPVPLLKLLPDKVCDEWFSRSDILMGNLYEAARVKIRALPFAGMLMIGQEKFLPWQRFMMRHFLCHDPPPLEEEEYYKAGLVTLQGHCNKYENVRNKVRGYLARCIGQVVCDYTGQARPDASDVVCISVFRYDGVDNLNSSIKNIILAPKLALLHCHFLSDEQLAWVLEKRYGSVADKTRSKKQNADLQAIDLYGDPHHLYFDPFKESRCSMFREFCEQKQKELQVISWPQSHEKNALFTSILEKRNAVFPLSQLDPSKWVFICFSTRVVELVKKLIDFKPPKENDTVIVPSMTTVGRLKLNEKSFDVGDYKNVGYPHKYLALSPILFSRFFCRNVSHLALVMDDLKDTEMAVPFLANGDTVVCCSLPQS